MIFLSKNTNLFMSYSTYATVHYLTINFRLYSKFNECKHFLYKGKSIDFSSRESLEIDSGEF